MTAAWVPTPLGRMLAIASETGLVLCEFADRRSLEREIQDVRRHFGAVVVPGTNAILKDTRSQLEAYFAGRRHTFTVPLDAPGSPFQQAVWRSIQRVPFGETRAYGAVARDVDRPGAVRAVGRATGHNRIAILIPCHRIVRADGTFSGYGGGRWRKTHLLQLERTVSAEDAKVQGKVRSGSPTTMARQLT